MVDSPAIFHVFVLFLPRYFLIAFYILSCTITYSSLISVYVETDGYEMDRDRFRFQSSSLSSVSRFLFVRIFLFRSDLP